jgi:hypothetical protein
VPTISRTFPSFQLSDEEGVMVGRAFLVELSVPVNDYGRYNRGYILFSIYLLVAPSFFLRYYIYKEGTHPFIKPVALSLSCSC